MKNTTTLLIYRDDGSVRMYPYGLGSKKLNLGSAINKIVNVLPPCVVDVLPDDSPPTPIGKRGNVTKGKYVHSTYRVSIGIFWIAQNINMPIAREVVAEYHREMLGVKP